MLMLLLGCGDPVALQQYLTVVNISPSHGAATISAETTVQATFNDPLVADSWTESVHLLAEVDQGLVPGTLEYADRTVTFTPTEALATGATYLFALTGGLEGESRGPLPAPIETRFTVLGPVDGQGLPEALIADTGCGGLDEVLSLDGQDSNDPDGDPLIFIWRVAHGPDEGLLEDADQPVALFTPTAEGLYVVGLVVNDGNSDSSEAFLELSCPGEPGDSG